MNQYTTKFPAGHPGTIERPNLCPVYTPDGGVIMCSTPADASRVAELGNAAERAKRMEAWNKAAANLLATLKLQRPSSEFAAARASQLLDDLSALNPGGAA